MLKRYLQRRFLTEHGSREHEFVGVLLVPLQKGHVEYCGYEKENKENGGRWDIWNLCRKAAQTLERGSVRWSHWRACLP